jgi:hypothetical protein
MPDKHDIVDSALQSLAGRRWPGANHNPELESKLMKAFDTQKSKNVFYRHPLVAACLALLVLGSFGFAAAGGVQMIKALFVTVEVDGIVVHDPSFDGGPVNVTVTTDETGAQTVTFTDENGNPLDAEGNVKTTVVESGECTMTIQQAPPAESEKDGD